MADHQLAQLNVAVMRAPLDSPRLAGFVERLERVNAAADAAPGFVWRLQSDDGDSTAFRPLGEDVLVNLSVWESVEALRAYVYGPAHLEVMRRRTEWFHAMREAHLVLWWVPAGRRPTLDEARARLERLRRDGPAPAAFTIKRPFAPPGRVRRATPDDRQAIERLLAAAGLPTDDIGPLVTRFVVIDDGDATGAGPVAAGALEPAGDDALLRSIVVAPSHRGCGLAAAICERLEADAARDGVRGLYLLTEGAAGYFAARGYRALDRGTVPPAVAATAQFASLCPASAVAMTRAPGAIVVREAREADLPAFFGQQRDPEACRVAAFEARPRDAFMSHWRAILADRDVVARTVLLDGRVAGHAVCFRRSGLVQVGYWIGREFWGRGAATAAVTALIARVEHRPLHAFVAPHNVGSQRVLERCGFARSDESLVDHEGPVDTAGDLLYRLGPGPGGSE